MILNHKGALYRISVIFRWNWYSKGFWGQWRHLWRDSVFALVIAVCALLQAAVALMKVVLHPLMRLLIEPVYYGLRAKDHEALRGSLNCERKSD
jgi:hypothetical protein